MVRSNHEVRSTEPKSNLIPTKIPIFWKSKSKQSEIDKKKSLFLVKKSFIKKIASYNLTLIIAHAFIENRNFMYKRMFSLLKSSARVRFGFDGFSSSSSSVRKNPKVRVRSVTTPHRLLRIVSVYM